MNCAGSSGRGGRGRSAICVSGRYLPDLTRDALRALVEANSPPKIFTRGGRLVRLRSDEGASLEVLDPAALKGVLARAARWYSKEGQHAKPARPPGDVVADILALGAWPSIPVIDRLVTVPVFGSSGVLQAEAGYSAVTHCYLALDGGPEVPTVPQCPSHQEVVDARALLLADLLGDFPFGSVADAAHAVALLLLPFIRDLIYGPTPIHVVESPTPGTGKTLLSRVALSVALGASVAEMPPAVTEDEWRKRLTAVLLAGAEGVFVDNVAQGGVLNSAALSAAVSAQMWEDRILGESRVLWVRPRCVWVVTGNNVCLSSELARRSIRLRLEATEERPWTRNGFRHRNLMEWAKENRGRLVQAALTLVQAWLAEGCPASRTTLGGFESWAGVVGGVLEVAEVSGFLANAGEMWRLADAEGSELGAFLHAWWEAHGTAPVPTSELRHLAPRLPTLFTVAPGDEHAAATSFGRQLAALRGRVADGKRIVPAGKKQGFALYRLEEASGA